VNDYREIVKWWKKKRLIYNLVLIGFTVSFILADYFARRDQMDNYELKELFLFAVIWVFGANIFYVFGSGFEAVSTYFGLSFHIIFRYFLYISAILFSIFWTLLNIPYPGDTLVF